MIMIFWFCVNSYLNGEAWVMVCILEKLRIYVNKKFIQFELKTCIKEGEIIH